MQVDLILKLFGSALSIWESHEKNYFLKQYIDLNKRYYEEKSQDRVDHAVLDNLEYELSVLINAFNSKIGG